jgi:immunoglobulin I-set domain protein
MMRTARRHACVVLALALLPRISSGQTLTEYAVGKSEIYKQTGPSQFSYNTATPFQFVASGAQVGSVTTPGANSQVFSLTYSTIDQTYEYVQNFATKAAMDAAFPSGTYTLSVSGESTVNLTLSGDDYPPVPLIINGSWDGVTTLLVDPSRDVLLNFISFPGYGIGTSVGEVLFSVSDNEGDSATISQSWTSLSDPMPTGITIPAGTLTAGQYYSATLSYFFDPTVDTTSLPGSLLFVAYDTQTIITILAQAQSVSPLEATAQPESQTVTEGTTVVFSFGVTGSPTPSLQWYLNGAAIPSATGSTLVVGGASVSNAGTYTCTATNSAGSLSSKPAQLSVVTTSNPGRLINLSARAEVGTGGNIVFGGFAIGPSGAVGKEPVLIRASGPAIAAAPFNVPGTLGDPQLQVFDTAGNVLDTNDGWKGDTGIAATAVSVGAFKWNDPASHDAALNISLASGPYTAQVAGESGDTGDALVEVYDATPQGTYTPSMPRLVNLSARVDVRTGGNALFAGFVIGGSTSITVLIRASGPAIGAAPFDVPGTLPDPQLTLQNPATGAVYAANNGWRDDPNIITAAASVGAFAWSDPASNDSALLVTLPPGSYTAEASGASGDTGVAIVEVYEVL